MSIATEITRLQGAKSALKTAIEGKGVSVPSSALIDAYPDLVDQIQQGGGVPVAPAGVDEEKPIVFLDYDGTPIASYTFAEARSLTALPDNPYKDAHSRLNFQGWTHTLAEVQALTYPQYVFACYMPKSGCMEIDIHLYTFLNPYLTPNFNMQMMGGGKVNIDWGDGQTTLNSSSVGAHTYAQAGKYTIKVEFLDESSYLRMGDSQAKQIITAFRLNRDFHILQFNAGTPSLRTVSFPQEKSIVWDGWGATGLTILQTFPYKVLDLSGSYPQNFGAMPFCKGMNVYFDRESITLGMATTRNVRMVVTARCTSLSKNTITGWQGVSRLIMLGETPPELNGTIAFSDVRCKIYVPDSAVDTYKNATNWSNVANYIYPMSSIE